MMIPCELAVRGGAMVLVHATLIRLLRRVKYAQAPGARPTTWGDWVGAAVSGLAVSGLAGLPPLGAALGIGLASLWFVVLWLDAALYRIFTFELGVGGVGGVVLSNLYREVVRLRSARQVFRTYPHFTLLPAVALTAHLWLLLPMASPPQLALGLALLGYLGWTLLPIESRAADPAAPGEERRALAHDFVRPRRPRIPPGFRPRPEHAALLAQQPAPPQPSAQHGILRGASVVLLTFESLGSAQLSGVGLDPQAQARTPFLDSLRADAVWSAHHFCLAPLTNRAHIALYASRPVAPPGPWSLSGLQREGYQTIYLTTAITGHYGLGGILKRAGFRQLIDGRLLAPHPQDQGQVSDRALLVDGVRQLRALLPPGRGPFFLHIHAADTHIPYRVVDQNRFCRHDSRTDRGRFLNGIEESDSLFGELWAALRGLGEGQPPLLVVSSDHGQSFGEQGYFSHGSAVSYEQLSVPLLLHHPRLAAGGVEFSTHFDVLPTILDLVGVGALPAGFGASIFDNRRTAGHLLWDGQPSRPTSSCLGLLIGERKYALDLIRGTCIESDWNDRNPRTLPVDERRYFEALIGTLASQQGIQ